VLAPGAWLLTCRAGLEEDLVEELRIADPRSGAHRLEPALVVSRCAPPHADGRVSATFAWQCFEITSVIRAGTVEELRAAAARAVIAAVPPGRAWGLHTWVPDAPEANRRAGEAAVLHAALGETLAAEAPELAARRVPAETLAREDGVLVQVCLSRGTDHPPLTPTPLPEGEGLRSSGSSLPLGEGPGVRGKKSSPTQTPSGGTAVVGRIAARSAPSLAPGGRERMRVPGEPPARSAGKLAAALAWLGVGPEPGELCVDLGAAPGGWTHVLLERRARVIAVDPARMSPTVAGRRGLQHVQASAFDWAPEGPVDWLFCDMAWRPLEVAALLAKWGRRRWTRVVVANVKLPMKRKVELLTRVREILAEGGFSDIRTRHLYHDRDEITLTAWRR